MLDRYRISLFAMAMACSGTAYAQGIPPAPADPADSPAPADNGGDIIVTAQRRAERLQDVPISITALNSDELQRRGVSDVSDLAGTVPGLNITTSAGQNSTNLVSLRGVAGQPLTIGASQATAIYLDGVYLTKPDAAFFALDDIERIEVLRGPQGTLYGRNATAGAINIVTRTPDTESFRASGSASYGNYNSYSIRGSASVPLGGGFAVGLSGAATGHDGYYTNTFTGRSFGDLDSQTGRIRLHYSNDDNFDAVLSGDLTRSSGEDVWRALYTGGVYTGIGDPDLVASNLQGPAETRVNTGGIALTANFHVSPKVVLTSISSWRTFDFRTIYDLDASAGTVAHTFMTNSSDTFNQEIRALYTGRRVRATIGANYYHDSADYRLRSNPTAFTIPVLRADSRPHDTSNLDALAAFAQVEFDLADSLTAIAGLRYNHETRDFTIDYSAQGAFAPVIGEIRDDALLPHVGLNFTPVHDVLLYGSISKGYQAPGFNFLPGAGSPINTFDAETLWAYELGAKTQFLDRAVTFNLSAFYYDYSDIQVRSVISQLIVQVTNAAAASVKGVEAELVIRPLPGLSLNGHVTYSRAVYSEFCDGIAATSPQAGDPLCAPGRADRAGNALNQAPRWSGGIGASYTAPLSPSINLNLNANYSWESNSYFTSVNEGPLSTGGWERLDGQVGLEFNDRFEVFAFGRNLTDDRYVGYAIRISPVIASGTTNEPRTYGIGARVHF